MDSFEINISGGILTVQPNEDGTYTIFNDVNKIANLYPDVTVEGVTWGTADLISNAYVREIGRLIESHEM